MSELTDIIKKRRSIRKFKSDSVPKELIDKVIEAGVYAASGRGKQAPVVIAVTNTELREKIVKANSKIGGWAEDFDPFYNAPVILIVIADSQVSTAVYDGSLTLGNMMLKAHELGLGSCWIHRAKQEFESELGQEILSMIGLEGNFEGIGHLALGYPDVEVTDIPEIKENRIFYID
ncbi:MAG: nitroreductase [Ruminococcus sp.]|nr:nitroreductase [Ruminococcus sp.]